MYREDPLVGKNVNNAVKEWVERPEFTEESQSSIQYHRFIIRKWVFLAACLVLIVLVSIYSVSVGDTPISFSQTYKIIWAHLTGDVDDIALDYLVINLRMPRVVIGILAGIGLAVSGTVMQSIMKNPLADPYTTGVSSGALFGVTLAMIMGYSFVNGAESLFMNALIFSMIPVFVIISISKMRSISPTVMIMAGIAVMYIFNAMTTLFKLRSDPDALAELYKWQVGSLTFSGWECVPIMLTVVVIGYVVMQVLAKKINVLATGDESATALGVNPDSLRRLCLFVVAAVTAVIVSFTGLIGFVGLVAPHIARIFVGADNRYLIPASAVFGAALLVTADLIGKTIIAPSQLQVGVVTAFFGGPLFLWLLLRKNSKVW